MEKCLLNGRVRSYLATRHEKKLAILRPSTSLAKIANEKGWSVVELEEDLASRSGLLVVKLALAN